MKQETTTSTTQASRPKIEISLLWVFVIALVAYRVWNLSTYPLHEDETATIEAMKSIVETGLPWTESGHIYFRALLAHYVMAIPLFFVEASDYSLRLVSSVASGAVLLLVHRMCLRLEDSLAGWIAVIFLAASSVEEQLASFSRHYILFQLGFTATVFYSVRFFLDRSNRAGFYLLAASIATIGTHQLSLEIGIPLALGLIIGRRFELLRTPSFWLSGVAIGLAFWLAIGIPFLVKPSWVFVNHLAMPLHVGGMRSKSILYLRLGQLMPFGLSLAVAGIVPAFTRDRRAWRLYLLTFVGCMVLVSLTAPTPGLRYIGNILPIAVVVAALTASWLIRAVRSCLTSPRWRGSLGPEAVRYAATLAILVAHLGLTENWNFERAFGSHLVAPDQRPHHEYIQSHFRQGDLIISIEPGLTRAYLGRSPDYFIRERRIDGPRKIFGPYTELEKGTSKVRVIDSPEMLTEIVEGHTGLVWVYVNRKAPMVLSPQSRRILSELRPVFRTIAGTVLLRTSRNHADSAEQNRPSLVRESGSQ